MLRKLLLRLPDRFAQKISLKHWKDEALIRHRDEDISSRSDAGVFGVRILMVWLQFQLELYKVAAAGCFAAYPVLPSLSLPTGR